MSAHPSSARSASRASPPPAGTDRLGERISAALAEIEAALGNGHDPDAVRDRLEGLRSLLAQQAARNRELASLSNFLQTHAEREKALLARELHDQLGGILTPAKMDLAWLESRLGSDPEYAARMNRLGTLIDQGIDLKRRIIEKLRPSLLDHLGLAAALQWYIEDICRQAGIECRLDVSEKVERLSPDLEIALYRLVQESVDNIVKHARAKTLHLTVDRTPDGLQLRVSDNGVGIADLEHAKGLSHGLAGMMHRVRSVDGTFDVSSTPGKGTRIEVFVPIKK